MRSPAIERLFPGLVGSPYVVTSPKTPSYNCIAWAAGRTDVWMWPDPAGIAFWPEDAPREVTNEAFSIAFGLLGYKECSTPMPEDGVEKVAIFSRHGKPTHAARQLSDGTWTSKCGKGVDISHLLHDVAGDQYGEVVSTLARPIATT